jgi:hypothetical protein
MSLNYISLWFYIPYQVYNIKKRASYSKTDGAEKAPFFSKE